MAKVAEKAAADKTTAAKKPEVKKDAQNGITRPRAGSKTGIVWEIADKLSTDEGPAERKAVLEATAKKEINPATAATQYGRWRKYHGLKGTGKAAAEVKETAAAK